MLRQFPTALKIVRSSVRHSTPNDPDLVAGKASIYQTQGKLQEAVKLLPQINEQTTSSGSLQGQDRSNEIGTAFW